MKINKKITNLILVIVVLILISSCNNSNDYKKVLKQNNEYKIVLILPGPINDKGWNYNNYSGIIGANTGLDINVEYEENIKLENFEDIISRYGDNKYDLIILAGAQFEETVERVAGNYKKTQFCILNGSELKGDNIVSISIKDYEASYIAAFISGKIDKGGKTATIASYQNNKMENVLNVYENKIRTENKAKEREVVRTFINSKEDSNLAKQVTEQIIDSGYNNMFIHLGEATKGVVEAVANKNINLVGIYDNPEQLEIKNPTVMFSCNYKKIYNWILNRFIENKLKGNELYELGFENNIFEIYYQNISIDLKKDINKEIEKIKSGTIEILEK